MFTSSLMISSFLTLAGWSGTAGAADFLNETSALASVQEAGEAENPQIPTGNTRTPTIPSPDSEDTDAQSPDESADNSADESGDPIADPFAQTEAAEDAPEVPAEAMEGSDRTQAQETERVGDYFAALETLSARFRQVDANGQASSGDLALSRPGRVRFDYDDPSPILLVADGSTVAIADSDLETVDRAPIRSTPLRWLLSSTDELESSGAITEVGRHDGQLYVTAEDPEGETEGRVTLVISDPDPDAPVSEMALQGWYAIDAYGGVTQVTLSERETGVSLNPRLFVLDDDMFGSSRRGRR